MKRSLSMRAGKLLVGLAAVTALGMAHAAPVTFDVPLDGAHEVPPVQTAGSGSAKLSFDPDTRVVTWKLSFSGLSGPATMAHFHGTDLGSTDIAVVFHGCQRCHNRYDAPMRAAGIKARREAERQRILDKAGQLAFEVACFGPVCRS